MKSRATAIAILMMLLLAACGARLTSAQRDAGIGAAGGGTADTGNGIGAAGGGKSGTGIGTSTGTTGGTGTGTGASTGLGAGAAACGGSGPNTASDLGVTPTQITVATASDVSGVQAALFKSTHLAMAAWAAMVNSQGGLCGRSIKSLLLDSKADSTGDQAAVKQACDSAFALVGSMSAFDNGGAETGQQCGIPDLTAITVNSDRAKATNVYPIYPIRPDKFAIGTANYIKQKYPDVIAHAAMVYLDAGVTKANAFQRVKAYRTVGFDFGSNNSRVYPVEVLEPSYSSLVEKMKNDGVQYVNMVANYQSIQKLLQAMDTASWYPKVRDWDSVAYSDQFANQNGQPFTPANGSFVFLNTNIYEEVNTNPEMQLYVQWLSRVAPGSKPDYFGFYAWSAGRLFQQLAAQIGPKLTRKALFDAVKKVHSWDGHGLHVAQDVGNKIMSPCFLYLTIQNGRFLRKDPASGFMCNKGGIINT